jgi:hypothetical protein
LTIQKIIYETKANITSDFAPTIDVMPGWILVISCPSGCAIIFQRDRPQAKNLLLQKMRISHEFGESDIGAARRSQVTED